MTTLSTPEAIDRFRLVTLRGAVRLEKLGMKRRGRSATVIAKEELGLKKSSRHDEVIAKLSELIEAV